VGRDRWRNYSGEPINNKSLREQFPACPQEWVTTFPFPPEEGGRYSLQNVEEILASEMDMSSLSHPFKKTSSEIYDFEDSFYSRKRMDSTANPKKLLARYGDSWAEDRSSSGFFFIRW
jgi:hypothetical protein